MTYLAIFFIMIPIILLLFDNMTKRNYETTKAVNSKTKHDIESIFTKRMNALENQDFDELKVLYNAKLYKKYYRRVKKNQIKDKKEYIRDPHLDGITNYKLTRNGFSVDLSYRVISYSKFDKNRIEVYWRRIDYFFTPLGNGMIGDKETYTQYKQRWWIKQNENQLQIEKIKNFYIKDN
ncbi:hypothetical protein ACFSJM_00015 [Lactococcus formosensis subsp. bovis]|uniref:hypothetical protein n=1 Tax=Lactococcus formosensis TaxID=1281486 RepID=UPI001BCCEC2C|nr:hypothetical protein [Lactococcus formosensis]